jgi:hypothetical protein
VSAFNRSTARSAPQVPADSPGEKTRYRVMAPIQREGKDKTFWLRVGTAFVNPARNGAPPSISVKLDALPAGGDLVLFVDEDREKDE